MEPDPQEVIADVKRRLNAAAHEMAVINSHLHRDDPEFWRTEGKRQGFLAAMDMLRGY